MQNIQAKAARVGLANSGLYGNINMTKYAAISLDRLEEIQQHADDTREE
jgi:hypothetical protein